MELLRQKKGYICDMDGVIYHGNNLLPGVKEFVNWMQRENKNFLFLTNGSGKSPKELHQKLARMGLDVDESHFYTSALATADFLSKRVFLKSFHLYDFLKRSFFLMCCMIFYLCTPKKKGKVPQLKAVLYIFS